ncbi:MAG: NnrS family protein [Methylomonas sp.]|jgi:uncharacterized protein involved in response to NO
MTNKPVFDYPLFAMGFRTFFALAGLSALAFIALWNVIASGNPHFNNYFPAPIWHAHEMLLGYASAIIAGFLLTDVKNRTGMPAVSPDQLAALGLLWLYGRIAPFYSKLLPDILIAGLDFVFLPALAYVISKSILKSGELKNLGFVLLLLLMTAANGLIHAQVLGFAGGGASLGINLLVMVMVTTIVFLAGRLIPSFTERGLSGVLCIRNPLFDWAAIIASLFTFGLVLADVTGALLAIAAAIAFISNALRFAGWYDRRIWYVPLLWVLYVGYGWIIIGFGFLFLSAYAWVLPVLALHAFTLGGIGVLTLGMMARVALIHTGRALKVSNIMAIVFLLINLSALSRILFPAFIPAWYSGLTLVSSYSWLAAFSLFIFYFTPILTSPRTDGQTG